ncbi:MAG TPA: transcription termination factor NusA [Anaerolineae bacterium]
MKNDFLVAITQICNDRNISKDIAIQAIEQALVSAYKRNFGGAQNITAKIDPNTGKARIFALKEVVEQVADRRMQISLDEARQIDPMAQVGSSVQLESTPDDFGRIAAQTAKQVALQKIREAERESLFQQFAKMEGEIIHGQVHSVDSNTITVSLGNGRVEGVLLKAEQIPTERYRHNQKIRVLISEVHKTSKGPQILLSRTHRNFLRRLLEIEVPEIYNGTVEIKSIAREPGHRSKVAVVARQDGIDPVGACVGQRGVRIQTIVNELSGEKIDVVEWSSDPAKFIEKALSPAQVTMVTLSEDENGDKVASVIVEDKQLSLAIGREGQNARLAAKLTGWRIDIKSKSQKEEERAKRQAELAALMEAETVAQPEPVAEPEILQTEPAQPTAEALVEESPAEAAAVTPAAEASAMVVEEASPVIEQPGEVAEVAAIAPVEPEENMSFAQAWAKYESELEEGEEGPEDERTRKKKTDKDKRRVLEFDEKLGQVVAKRKRKGGRSGEEWEETPEE